MKKKLYWLIENCDEQDQKESQYTITPVWYTDDEFEKLPEA